MSINFINELKNAISSNIPTSSNIIGEVVKTIYDKSSSVADLADLIERDPPLSARVLKTANSAYFGSSVTINSIKRAIVILGFDIIKELTTTVSVVHYFFNNPQNPEIDLPGLWKHSVGTAKAAQIVSQKINQERPEVVYTIGLLHDLGKIILAISFPDYYKKVLQLVKEKNYRIILAEQKILNTDHCMMAKILCDSWNLPEELSAAIFYHHDPMMTPQGSQVLARLVNVGDYICRKAKIGNPGDDTLTEPSKAVMSFFGTTTEKINENIDPIYQEFIKSRADIEGFFLNL